MKGGVPHWQKKQMFKIAGVFPYVIALFLNAFTDLGHKIIIQNTVFKIYDNEVQIILTAIVNALVLLPFVLLFSPSGYLADKYAKNTIMKHAAAFAVVITLLITLSYYMGWFEAAFAFTFLLAVQSAFYSPAKYGYIKELVGEKHLTSGNATVQSVTTVAILSGIIFYTVLFENSLDAGYASEADILQQVAPLGWLLVAGSVIEWYMAARLPRKVDALPKKRFDFRRYKNGYYLRKNFRTLRRKESIYIAVIALSLFWSISQVVLAVFGAYAKSELGVENTIMVQGVMALAAIGIVLGSVAAAKLSRYYIHMGLVPFGAFGLALMVLLLPFSPNMGMVAVLFTSFGFFAGLFIVPLNAYIQKAAPRIHLGTILAANNFMQNLLMFGFLMLTTLFAYYGVNSEGLFYLMFAIALGMAVMLSRRYSIMFIRFVVTLALSLRYKFQIIGEENIPKQGALLLLGNHISWIDWFIAQLPLERSIRYLMDRGIYEWKLINPIMRIGKIIPVSPKASKEGFIAAREHIAAKGVVGVFPEGSISYSGELGKFYRGFELISGTYNGKIVPFYIDGIYGSILSRSKTHYTQERSGWRRVVTIIYGEPMPLDSNADEVREAIIRLKEKHGAQ